MSSKPTANKNNDIEPWQWGDSTWQNLVKKVRAGKSLKPKRWKNNARVAVALSFDSDHETTTLRWGDGSPGKLSQGEYGSRAAVPRIRRILRENNISASFFVPAVVAKLHPDEQRNLVNEGHEIGIHGWIHEFNSTLREADERELMLRAAVSYTHLTLPTIQPV